MKILFTGATGFIGSEVLVQLLARGTLLSDIHLLARSRPRAGGLLDLRLRRAGMDAPKILADLAVAETSFEDESRFRATLAQLGSQSVGEKWRVLHLAAVISTAHAPSMKGLGEVEQKRIQLRVNLGVTADLLEWGAQHADRFVYASSIVAFGGVRTESVRSEKDFPQFPQECRHIGYFASKRAAHEFLLEHARVPAVILCPGIVHGAYENFKSSRGHLKLLRQGKLPFAPPGGGNFVGLDRVAGALAEAICSAQTASRTQLLVDRNLSYAAYFALYAARFRARSGRPEPRPMLRLPAAPVDALLKGLMAWPWASKLRAQMLESVGQSRFFLYFASDFPEVPTAGLEAALDDHFNTLS